MLVRVRVGSSRVSNAPSPREIALACAALLTPSALLAFTMAVWNIAADLRWTSRFIVPAGVLSHWQAWFCFAALLLALARLLVRYGVGPSEAIVADREAVQISIEKFEKEFYI